MRLDAGRDEVATTLRRLAGLIHASLPKRVRADDVFLPWETTAATLLARIAGQGNTLAVLVEGEHELDAEMVMRSLLEHTTLLAWLAVTPQDNSPRWKARDPDQNTLWWMVDQYRHDKKLTEDRARWLGGVLDDDMRAGLRAAKRRVNALPARGVFPTVAQRAAEVDAYWGPRLPGWRQAEAQTPEFAVTFHGHYWTLYTHGSSSVHPTWNAIRRFLRPPRVSGYQRHYLQAEETSSQVGPFISIAAYLMADAIAVADAALGWTAYDDALRLLGRWDEVRGPDLLIEAVREILGEQQGRRHGRVRGRLVSVEIFDGELAVVVVDDGSVWSRLVNQLGTRHWTLHEAHGEDGAAVADGGKLALGPAVTGRLDLLAEVEWDHGSEPPENWPEGAP